MTKVRNGFFDLQIDGEFFKDMYGEHKDMRDEALQNPFVESDFGSGLHNLKHTSREKQIEFDFPVVPDHSPLP